MAGCGDWKEPNLELICSPEHMKQDIDVKENCLSMCLSSFNQDVSFDNEFS